MHLLRLSSREVCLVLILLVSCCCYCSTTQAASSQIRSLRTQRQYLYGTEQVPPTPTPLSSASSSSISVMPSSMSSMAAIPPSSSSSMPTSTSAAIAGSLSASSSGAIPSLGSAGAPGESSFPASALSASSAESSEHSESSEGSVFTAAKLSPKDGSLYPTKIVDHLSSSTKRFVKLESGGQGESSSESAEYSQDDGDPELTRLKNNLKAVQDNMVNSRRWVEVVRGVIAHYRNKILSVESNLKQDAMEAYRLKALIVKQHKNLAKQRLQVQLDKVVAALKQLQDQTSTVSSKKQDLESMKRELMANIGSIQSQIASLHESAPSNAAAASAAGASESSVAK